jgi:hypothetical protein
MYELKDKLEKSQRKIRKLMKIYRKTWNAETKILLDEEEKNYNEINNLYWYDYKYYKN